MSSRVGVLSVEKLSEFLEQSVIHSVTELPSINIIVGYNTVSGDFTAISSATGDCAVVTGNG